MMDFVAPLLTAFTTALAVAHVAGALAVTAHVLLRQRNVNSAIGWIALAWLATWIGSLLYVALGINRVQRRARRLRRRTARLSQAGADPLAADHFAGHFAALHEAGGRITGRIAETGNAVTLLEDGDAAYPAMLEAIANAQSTIAFCSYIFRGDEAGDMFVAALAAAQARGVEVRVLVDGIGGGYLRSGGYRRLVAAGLKAELFMHTSLPWRTPILNMRTHRKILVVDGAVAFTGGINVAVEHLLSRRPADPIRDTHFRLTGPIVTQLAEVFAEDWHFTTGETLARGTWMPPAPPAPDGTVEARVITAGPDHDLDKLSLVMLIAIGEARRAITIVTPYFLPDDRLASALELAALRGVKVDLIVPQRSDHRLIDWAVRAQLPPLLKAGARVLMADAPFDHSKLMVIDGFWSLIGSANWDMRSLRLNFELNVEVYDEVLAGEIAERIAAQPVRELTLGHLLREPLALRLRNAAARLLHPYL